MITSSQPLKIIWNSTNRLMGNSNILQLDFGFDIPAKEDIPQSKPSKSDYVFDLMDCISSPIMVFNTSWPLPADLLKIIHETRMVSMLKHEELASIPEVVAYMMPRTFEAPMPYEWTNIYTWCGMEYVRQYRNIPDLDDRQIAPEKLTDYEQGLLKHLRSWIYDKRRKALKNRLKVSKNSTLNQAPETKQPELFESSN